jgi:hypothetical protein
MKATRENSFTIDSDGVDPDLVPKRLLDSGSKIPCIEKQRGQAYTLDKLIVGR